MTDRRGQTRVCEGKRKKEKKKKKESERERKRVRVRVREGGRTAFRGAERESERQISNRQAKKNQWRGDRGKSPSVPRASKHDGIMEQLNDGMTYQSGSSQAAITNRAGTGAARVLPRTANPEGSIQRPNTQTHAQVRSRRTNRQTNQTNRQKNRQRQTKRQTERQA
jgi:hypothetical protein